MKRILFSILLITVAAGMAFATTVVRMQFDRQATEAGLVVIGKVTSSREIKWHSYPATLLTVRIEESIVGETVGQEIQVMQPGAGKFKVIGIKPLSPNEEYLFFLEKLPEGYYRILGFNQGLHSISVERTTGRKIIRIEKGYKDAPGMTLDAARSRIRAVRENNSNNGVSE